MEIAPRGEPGRAAGSGAMSGALVVACASCVACSAVRPDAGSREGHPPELAARPAPPQTAEDFRRALERPISFLFDETPLTEAAREIAERTGLNVIVDPRAVEQGEPLVTLRVDGMSLEKALSWLADLTNTGCAIRDEALVMTGSAGERFLELLESRTYDVRDLTKPLTHRPAPVLGLCGETASTAASPEPEEHTLTPEALAEGILTNVRPAEWSAELGTMIENRDGRIAITQRPEVHALVTEFLDEVKAERTLQVRVETRLIAVRPSLIEGLNGRFRRSRGPVCLPRSAFEAIVCAVKSGEARLVDEVELTCLNGQRNYALSGRSTGGAGGGANGGTGWNGARRAVEFRGTVVEASPLLSFDGGYVTMDLCLSRYEDGGGDDGGGVRGGVDVMRFNSTVTCRSGETVLVGGAAMPSADGAGPSRLLALVTATVLGLEPSADRASAERPRAEAASPACPRRAPQ